LKNPIFKAVTDSSPLPLLAAVENPTETTPPARISHADWALTKFLARIGSWPCTRRLVLHTLRELIAGLAFYGGEVCFACGGVVLKLIQISSTSNSGPSSTFASFLTLCAEGLAGEAGS
jgi:hypothetical protein